MTDDEETIFESLIEITTRGKYTETASELLQAELPKMGFSKEEIHLLIHTSEQGYKSANQKKYADCIYQYVTNKNNLRNNLHDIHDIHNLHAFCLLCSTS